MDRLKLFETEETIWDIKVTYYATIEDGYVVLSKSTELSDEIKECVRDKVVSDLKNDIFNQLERYFEDWLLYYDLPIFIKGWYLTESNFNLIISNIRFKFNRVKQEAEKSRTTFIDYLESVGLRPRPSGGNKFSWMADCPFSKGKHWMMVSTKNNNYGCGWCKKKGNQWDLENYLKTRKL
jgi:hypothetical protein